MEMHDRSTGHIVVGSRLHCHMLIELRDGGEPPLTVLEREGKWWSWLTPPGLGPGALRGPTPLKCLIFTSFHLFCPRLAIAHSTCLHGSRCARGGNGSFSTQSLIDRSLCNRSLHDRSLCNRSLSDRSHRSSHTRPIGASGLGIQFHLRLLAGLTGGHLRPSRQGDPRQVQTLMEAALLSYQSMIVAPLLYSASETPEAIQVEAHSLIKMVFDVGHKIHQASFFEAQGFLLMGEEVFEKLPLEPHPFRLLKGGNIEFVVDPEHMLQVLLPTTTVKFHRQSHRIVEGRPWPTSPLRLSSFRCRWWWNTWH